MVPGTHAPRVWLELYVLLQSVAGELKAMCAVVLSERLQLEVGCAGSVCGTTLDYSGYIPLSTLWRH